MMIISEKGPTPTPWYLDGYNMASILHCVRERGHPEAIHTSGDYELIARCEGENWKANALFILNACNMHEELMDIIFMVLPYIEDAAKDPCYKPGAVNKAIRRIMNVIEEEQKLFRLSNRV